jgi:hypothetical protein
MQELSGVLTQRRGAVLTASTILKADVYPSLLAPWIPQPLVGAPNLRQADGGLPVFGAGISSLQVRVAPRGCWAWCRCSECVCGCGVMCLLHCCRESSACCS